MVPGRDVRMEAGELFSCGWRVPEPVAAQAEATDAAEDAEYGADRRGDELPAELQRRETRLERIREAKRVLEARAKDEAAAAGQPTDAAKPAPKPNITSPIRSRGS